MNPLDLAQPFQVRLHESRGLKALFEKVFFDVPYSDEAIDALRRTEFPAASDEGVVDHGAAEEGASQRPESASSDAPATAEGEKS